MQHHAQLLIGTLAEALPYISLEDRQEGPDVLLYTYEKFGIDDARKLTYEASLRPVEKQSRVFIVSFGGITTEAQNALLKLFEEPSQTARFYIVTPSGDALLPTLRSRCMLTACQRIESEAEEANAFLRVAPGERLAVIAERAKSKDTAWFGAVITGIEKWAAVQKDAQILREIVFVRSYDKAPSASQKMLLEHLALSLPVIS